MMINKKAKDLSLPFPPNAIMHDNWLSLVVSALGKIEYIDIPTALYRQHGKNVSGAEVFDFTSIKNKIIKFKEEFYKFKKDLKALQLQAKDFVERYGNILPNEILELVQFFVEVENINRFVRLLKVVKHGFLYHKSFTRNLGKLFLRWFLL
ncbi:MAG: hypothetical protein ACP5QP_00590 [Brevinematia bacterium]